MIYARTFWGSYETDLMKYLRSQGFYLHNVDIFESKENQPVEIWACSFKTTESCGGKLNFEKPVLGILKNRIFTKYKKNKKECVSKGVSDYARYFTSSEEECRRLYNCLIEFENDKLRGFIKQNEEEKI